MQIHRVRGTSLKEALLRARRMLGEDAVVVSQEILPGGEIALAVAQREESAAEVESTIFRAQRARAEEHPALRELEQRLERTGVSPALRTRIVAALRGRNADQGHVLDAAADEIGRLFPPARLPRLQGKTRVLAFAGATGVGKTTSIVKLAKRMRASGRRVELATLDSARVGAVEQLRAWANSLELPLTVLKRGVRMNPAALSSGSVDMVLLDTTGHPRHDAELLAQLRKAFEPAAVQLDVHLVLAAPASRDALEAAWKPIESLAPVACSVTKLDETHDKALALEFALEHALPVAFVNDGADVDLHFHRAGGEAIADLWLRGRIA
jgi:flagellar biosynthesis protein FlhF